MNAPVDVLAVFDDELIKARSRGDEQGYAYLREARASVDELIEAAQTSLYDMREVRDRCTSLKAIGLDEQVDESIDRIAAALARVGGAA